MDDLEVLGEQDYVPLYSSMKPTLSRHTSVREILGDIHVRRTLDIEAEAVPHFDSADYEEKFPTDVARLSRKQEGTFYIV